ncbi:MAG: ferritin family protein [Bacillota bacterium]|nr:ferritin family protein [Bacillota bacterium]
MTKTPKNIHLLLDDYAGKASETTAIKQYLHHYLVVEEEDVADLLEEVAIEEMRHLEQLGHTLEEAGVDPRYWDSKKKYWTGAYVNYQENVCDILQADIEAELGAILQYYQHMEAICDPHVEMMLRKIINDELRHISLFMEKQAKYCPNCDHKSWLKKVIEKMPLDKLVKGQLVNDLRLTK